MIDSFRTDENTSEEKYKLRDQNRTRGESLQSVRQTNHLHEYPSTGPIRRDVVSVLSTSCQIWVKDDNEKKLNPGDANWQECKWWEKVESFQSVRQTNYLLNFRLKEKYGEMSSQLFRLRVKFDWVKNDNAKKVNQGDVHVPISNVVDLDNTTYFYPVCLSILQRESHYVHPFSIQEICTSTRPWSQKSDRWHNHIRYMIMKNFRNDIFHDCDSSLRNKSDISLSLSDIHVRNYFME